MILKTHEFRELVNDIRDAVVNYIPSDIHAFWHWLKCQDALCQLSEENIHYIFCICETYCNAAQLREKIAGALKKVGINYD